LGKKSPRLGNEKFPQAKIVRPAGTTIFFLGRVRCSNELENSFRVFPVSLGYFIFRILEKKISLGKNRRAWETKKFPQAARRNFIFPNERVRRPHELGNSFRVSPVSLGYFIYRTDEKNISRGKSRRAWETKNFLRENAQFP
jgi:hypothetical protein